VLPPRPTQLLESWGLGAPRRQRGGRPPQPYRRRWSSSAGPGRWALRQGVAAPARGTGCSRPRAAHLRPQPGAVRRCAPAGRTRAVLRREPICCAPRAA